MLLPHLEIVGYLSTPQLERIHAAATVKMRDGWRCALAVALDTPVLAGSDVARALTAAVGTSQGGAATGAGYGTLRRKAQRFLDWWDGWLLDHPLAKDPPHERLRELREAVQGVLEARRAVASAEALLDEQRRAEPIWPTVVAAPRI